MKGFTLAAALIALSAPAYAADVFHRDGGLKDDLPGTSVESVNWGGLYVGAHGGYAWGTVDVTRNIAHAHGQASTCTPQKSEDGDQPDPLIGLSKAECEADDLKGDYKAPHHSAEGFDGGTDFTRFDSGHQTAKDDMNGFFGGLGLSYKFMVNHRVILEPFADLSFGGGKGNVEFKRDFNFTNEDGEGAGSNTHTDEGSASIKKRWGGTLGMKAGVLVTERDYIYALGGLAYGSFKIQGGSALTDGLGVADNIPESAYDKTAHGWGYTVGGGYERALTDRLHFGLEGRWTSIDGLKASGGGVSFGDLPCPPAYSTNEKIEADYGEVSVMGRLSYKLGGY